jgi:hypothetical protein
MAILVEYPQGFMGMALEVASFYTNSHDGAGAERLLY